MEKKNKEQEVLSDSEREEEKGKGKEAIPLKKRKTMIKQLVTDDEKVVLPEENEKMLALYEETFRDLEEGRVVKGTIVRLGENQIVVDIGYKSEGTIPLSEFAQSSTLKVGDEIEVLLEETEDQEGMIVLSKRKADRIKNWEKIVAFYAKEEPVEGKIIGRVKGGYSVDIGMEAFLPASQVSVRPGFALEQLIGKKMQFKVIKLNRRRKNVVISHRALQEVERAEGKSRLLSELEKGQTREGVVKNITDFGAFVDLGGIDGLLHITDITWGRISHPSEVVAVGDKIEVVILDFNKETQRISLGLKQKTRNPWLDVGEKYPVGSRQKGRVVNITDYGAFVELEEGVEGLVHISEMSWTRRLNHPSELVAIGDIVEVVVLNADMEHEKISLGIKQVEPSPWEQVEGKYPVGTRVKGKVRNLTDYGVFVELEEGIDGLIHVSDLSWGGHINHPSELVKKGDKLEAVVLSIDPANKRISLGLKQLQSDPWKDVGNRYHLGQIVKGKVTKLVSFGAFVELEEGIEALIHVSQLEGNVNKPEKVLSVDEEITVRIIRVEPEQRKIGLSIRALKEEVGAEEKKEEIITESESDEQVAHEPSPEWSESTVEDIAEKGEHIEKQDETASH